MTDRELYNYIKANYKPQKGTTLFFDLTNFHLNELNPVFYTSDDEVDAAIRENGAKRGYFATFFYLNEELIFNFHSKEFDQTEYLSSGYVDYFHFNQEIDMEKVKEELAALALLLNYQRS